MNILILNWRDPKHPLAGGAEISLMEHAKYWKKQGASILWISSKFEGCIPSEKIRGIEFLRIGNQFTVHIMTLLYYLLGKLKRPADQRVPLLLPSGSIPIPMNISKSF